MNKPNLNDQLRVLAKRFVNFRREIFIVLVIVIYAFLVWRIVVLKNAQPSPLSTTTPSSTTTSIDKATVDKINQLQNNSVNVQALFNQARQDPFAE